MTQDLIIKTVCEALQLDRDKLLIDKAQRNKGYKDKYTDGCYIAAYLIRTKVLIPKETKKYGVELKQPTYKEVAYTLKRKAHSTIMDWELEAYIALKEKKPEFTQKYNMVVNLLDKNVNIA